MKTKGILLFLLILLPVLIFLFLKIFGANQFDIPVLYSNGVGDTLQYNTCIDRNERAYVVENPLINTGKNKVIHFERMDGPVLKTRLEELEKVQDVFYNNTNIHLTTYLNTSSINPDAIKGYDHRITFMDQFWSFEQLDSSLWAKLKFCDLVMSDLDNRVVLVDAKNQIRGYYNIMEREETDRLILELRILESQNNE